MLTRVTLCMSVLVLGLGPAQAHVPEGPVRGIWQWPADALPVMDGDLSEWEVVPDSLWIDLGTLGADGSPLFRALTATPNDGTGSPEVDYFVEMGGPEVEADPADLAVRLAIGWNDETDRLYFAQQRFDEVFDRDGLNSGAALCGEDGIELLIDADHSGGRIGPEGRTAQISAFGFPPIDTQNGHLSLPMGLWHLMWPSFYTTWPAREPYSCCPDSYILEGQHGAEATLTAEWWSVYYNDWDSTWPENSVQADLSEGQIIGMGIRLCDSDLGTPDAVDSRATAWVTAGPRGQMDADHISDWVLLPVSDYWTGVESTTWGQVKASFKQ